MRIVTLIASATEITCALGLRKSLVGRSHECDYPLDVLSLPVLSSPKVDPSLPSGDIDRGVRDLVGSGLSVYDVSVDSLEKLAPDLIVTQDQCEVCAVSLSDVENALCVMTKTSAKICALHPITLDDVRHDFQRVADAANVPERGHALRERFDTALNNVADVARHNPPVTIALIEWLDPPMIAGGWMPEIATIAGAHPVIVTEPKKFATVTWDDIAHANPDVVVIMPCGYELDQTLAELRSPQLADQLHQIPATRKGRCFVADGNAYFNRPGPRLADSAEILRALTTGELDNMNAKYGNVTARWAINTQRSTFDTQRSTSTFNIQQLTSSDPPLVDT